MTAQPTPPSEPVEPPGPLEPSRPADADPAPGVAVVVVVPAFRVAEQIEAVLDGVPAWVRAVLVVDDASPDDLAARVERRGEERVELLRHERNQGVGGAVVTGFRRALELGADVVVKMDGDGQMDPAYLPALLEPLLAGEADLAKGNRYRDREALRDMPAERLVGNTGLTFLLKLASGHWDMFDPTNGYLALRVHVLRLLDLDRLPRDYFFESGLLIELGVLRARVRDVAIPARYGSEPSSLSVGGTLVGFPGRLVAGLCRRVARRYFLFDFTAVSAFLALGLPLFLFGVVFGAVHWIRSIRTGEVASTGTVMVAALPIILGFQLLLQALVVDIAERPSAPLSPPLRRDA